jgi:hypothetical protein
MEVSGQLYFPAALPPGEGVSGTHWIGGRVSLGAGLEAVAKRKYPCPFREPNPGRPAHSLVTVLTELYWLKLDQYQNLLPQIPT